MPPAAQQALARVQQELGPLRAVRWTRPEQIHLTLQFLGNTPAAKVTAIVTALEGELSNLAPFAVSLSGVGAFPSAKRAGVIWAGILEGAGNVRSRRRAVIRATGPLGFEPEGRPFKPHLTIGRVQRWAAGRDLAGIEQALRRARPGQVAAFRASHASLVRSRLKPSGPVYTTLAEVSLTGEAV